MTSGLWPANPRDRLHRQAMLHGSSAKTWLGAHGPRPERRTVAGPARSRHDRNRCATWTYAGMPMRMFKGNVTPSDIPK